MASSLDLTPLRTTRVGGGEVEEVITELQGLYDPSGNDMGSTNWTPSITASGSMTVSAVVINIAQYFRVGVDLVFYSFTCNFTLGGTTSTEVILTFPLTIAAGTYVGNTFHLNGGSYQSGIINNDTTTSLTVRKRDSGTWTLGSGNYIWASGFVKV